MPANKFPVLVFIGQPNSGKSTLFNAIAGHKAETSNFPGTTVEHTHSRVNIEGRLLSIIDLPGTYSLSPTDPAEKVVLTHLFSEKPDIIINIVDASILSRSLELTLELLELEYPMVIALNMMDLAERKGVKVDVPKLEARLGVPVIPTIAIHGRGIKELLEEAFQCLDRGCLPPPMKWSRDVEEEVENLQELLPEAFPIISNKRFTAIKMIEGERLFFNQVLKEMNPDLKGKLDRIRRNIEEKRKAPAYEVLSAERHHLAHKIFEETSKVIRGKKISLDEKIDDILMHPFFGYPILLAIFFLFFAIIFKIGNPLEEWILGPLTGLREFLSRSLGDSLLFFLVDGLIQGIGGGVAIVLPYFLPLLFLMAFLEDLGYLSRAGFLLDTFMHRIGLHGKSVSPFILGFGCNVPAIVSTRTLESRRDRVITALLIPFIPCSARTTIILALVAYYLGPLWALIFYVGNIAVVAVIGRVITFFFKSPSPGLILDIPSLKVPSLKNMLKKTVFQLKSFIKFAWPILIAGSIVLSLFQFFEADRYFNTVLSPLVTGALGLPEELGITLVFGFLRKELSLIMMLQALGVDYQNLMTVISKEQIVIFTIFISFFIPCLSTFAILWREVGRKIAFLSAGISIAVAVSLAWLVRLLF